MINWRHLVFAGVGGLACGKGLTVAKRHPDTAKTLLTYSAASSLVGVALGLGVAAYRKAPLHIYGFSTGANFALCSFTFFGLRHMIVETVPWPEEPGEEAAEESARLHPLSSWKQEYLGSVLSGGVTGSLASILSRHQARVILGTGLGGVVVGFIGQWSYLRFNHWHKTRAVLHHYPHLATQPSQQWTVKAFEDQFISFWHRRSEVSKVESEILVLEHEVKVEQQRIKELDELLASSSTSNCNASDYSQSETDYSQSETVS